MIEKIVIAGNYGGGNLGDEMILRGVLEMTKNIFPKAEITVLSANPYETEKMHKVKSLYLFPSGIRSFWKGLFKGFLKTTRNAVKECDLFVLGGGGLFASIKKRANMIWGLQTYFAGNKPLFILGQSLENIGGFYEKMIVSRVFGRAKYIVLRDEKSKAILDTIGIKTPIYVLPDLAFRTQVKQKENHQNKKVIFALRRSKTLSPALLNELYKFEKWLKDNKGYEMKFLGFHKTDSSLHENTIIPQTIDEMFNLYNESKFAICMPLHATITAIKTETPFIALNYAEKVKSFLEYVELEKYSIDMNKISFEFLKERFEELEKNYLKITEDLNAFNKKAEKEMKDFEGNFKSSNVS